MIFSTKIQLIGNSLAIIIPKQQLTFMRVKEGEEIEVFLAPINNKKIIFKEKDVFCVLIKNVAGSQGFYLNKEVVDDLKLKKGDWVEVLYRVRK
jgi:hypothetical protein